MGVRRGCCDIGGGGGSRQRESLIFLHDGAQKKRESAVPPCLVVHDPALGGREMKSKNTQKVKMSTNYCLFVFVLYIALKEWTSSKIRILSCFV